MWKYHNNSSMKRDPPMSDAPESPDPQDLPEPDQLGDGTPTASLPPGAHDAAREVADSFVASESNDRSDMPVDVVDGPDSDEYEHVSVAGEERQDRPVETVGSAGMNHTHLVVDTLDVPTDETYPPPPIPPAVDVGEGVASDSMVFSEYPAEPAYEPAPVDETIASVPPVMPGSVPPVMPGSVPPVRTRATEQSYIPTFDAEPQQPKKGRKLLTGLVAVALLLAGIAVGIGAQSALTSKNDDDREVVAASDSTPPRTNSVTTPSTDPATTAPPRTNPPTTDPPTTDPPTTRRSTTTRPPRTTTTFNPLNDPSRNWQYLDPGDAFSISESAAGSTLGAIAQSDYGRIESNVSGYWVPQISSKYAGAFIDGYTWDDNDILNDHLQLRTSWGDPVYLLRSSEWAYADDRFLVTIVGIPYTNPDDALAWCVTHSLGPDDCYAKRIYHGERQSGDTKYQS